ncbi:MAG TPA: hypothetical protein VGJ90_04140 [Methylophilaceae bacterium]
MESSNTLASFWQYTQASFAHAKTCVNLPLNTYECKTFWLRLDLVLMGIVAYLIVRLVVHLVRMKKIYKDHINWLAEQDKVADAATMAKVKWTGESSPIDDLPQEEAADYIRQNLEAKKSS